MIRSQRISFQPRVLLTCGRLAAIGALLLALLLAFGPRASAMAPAEPSSPAGHGAAAAGGSPSLGAGADQTALAAPTGQYTNNNHAGQSPTGAPALPPVTGRASAEAGLTALLSVAYPGCPSGYQAAAFPLLSPGTHTIDTSALTLDGVAVPTAQVVGGLAVFPYTSIDIPAGVTLRGVGGLPLALMSQGSVTIAGTVSVDGSNATPTAPSCQARTASPGGAGGGAGGLGVQPSPGAGSPGSGPGGGGAGPGVPGAGGAGFGGNGSAGGNGGGAGGSAYGDLTVALDGGSGGGGAGTPYSGCSGASGGGGGGGLLIYSIGSITVAPSGVVSANGGNGALSDAGASGGGSGGGIALVAGSISNSGLVRANGGTGGPGGCCGGGGAGAGGRILFSTFSLAAGTTQVNGGAATSGGTGGAAAGGAGVTTQDTTGALYDCPADMSLSKWGSFANPDGYDGFGTAIAGGELIYTFQACNAGPNVAAGVTVTDVLPPELTYLADTLPPGGGCVEDPAGTLTCNVGTVNVLGCRTFQVKTAIDPMAAAQHGGPFSLTNEATVSAYNPDPDDLDNTAQSTDLVQELADLKVTKLSEPHDVVQAGQSFTYTIYVDNFGPSASRNVIITDTLLSSSNVTIQSCAFSVSQGGGSITQFTCTTGSLVSTQFGTDVGTMATNVLEPLSPTSQGRLRLSFRLVAKGPLDVTNTVRVTADTPDPDMSDNMAQDAISVLAMANLALTAPCVPDPVRAGSGLVCSLSVQNLGPSAATNVRIAAGVPDVFEVTGVTGLKPGGGAAGCTAGTPGDAGDPATCDFGTLMPSQSGSMQLSLHVLPSAISDTTSNTRQVQIDAVASSETFDADLSNNYGHETVTINARANLGLRKFAVGTPLAGGVIHYEYQVTNAGPSVAENVTLRDFLPSQVEFLSAAVQLPGQAGYQPLPCTITAGSNVLFCPLGDLEPTGSEPVLVFVNVRIDPDAIGSITNSADVNISDTPDPDTENNTASVTTALRYDAELAIEKTAISSSVTPPGLNREGTVVALGGGTLTYRITVTNHGPSTAYNVIVTDPLAAGLTYRYSTSAACTWTGTLVRCNLGRMEPWQVKTFEITVGVDQDVTSGSVDNTSCVRWQVPGEDEEQPEQVTRRACDSESVPVDPVADLRVRKFGKPDGEVRAGQLLTYTIMVDNLGPSYAPQVVVTDELRASGEFDIMGMLPDATLAFSRTIECRIDAPTSDAPINPIITWDPVGRPYFPNAEPIAPHVQQRATISCYIKPGEDTQLPVFGPGSGPTDGRLVIEIAVMAREGVSVNNCVDVSSAATDPDFGNNSACTQHEVTEVADLGVTKTATGQVGGCGELTDQEGAVTPGNEITFDIEVTNYGPSTAENVVLKDRLPEGIRVTGYEFLDGEGSCVSGAAGSYLDELVCGMGTVATGTAEVDPPVHLQVTALVDPGVPDAAVLENDVVVTSDQFDNYDANNYAVALTAVDPIADVYVDKLGPEEQAAGTVETYLVHVGNDGPSTARRVTVVDVVEPGMEIRGATVLGGQNPNGALQNACTVVNMMSFDPYDLQYNPSNAVVCDLGDLVPGPAGERDIAVDVYASSDVPDGTPVSNFAFVTSGTVQLDEGSNVVTPDCDYGNNSTVYTTTVLTMADLWLTKTSEPQKVYAGEQIKYHLRVGNDGPSTARDVVVTDLLPPGVTYEVDTDHCQVADIDPGTGGQVLQCFVGDIEPDQVVKFDIWVRVEPCLPAGTELVNTACVPWEPEVNTTLGDPDPDNNCDDARTLVLAKADLKVTKFGKPDGQVRAGDVLTYTVMVDNLGPSCAADVSVKDLMQSSKVFDLIDVSSDRLAYCVGQPGPAGYSVPPEPFGSLPPAPAPFQVLAGRGGVANISQRLELDCTLVDQDQHEPGLGKSGQAGQLDQLEPLSAVGFPNGGRWILTMRVRARETQDINNVATVLSATALDPDQSNNQAQVEHDITDVADLSVTKTASAEEQQSSQPGLMFNDALTGQAFPTAPNYFASTRVTAGRRIMYTLTVRNAGPSTAENVVLSDRLPAGVQMYPGSLTAPAGINCQTGTAGNAADRLTCGIGTLHSGQSASVTFQVVTDGNLPAGTVLENDAHTYSDIFDPSNDDNYANTQTPVLAAADMRAYKTAMGEVLSYSSTLRRWVVTDTAGQVTPGQQLRYEVMVQNNGPSTSRNVTVQETLPPTTQVQYLRSEGATCLPSDVQANVLYCSLGDMAAGARKTFEIYVRVDPAATSLTQNCALVLSNPSNTSPPGPPPSPPTNGPTELLTWDPYTTDNQSCATATTVPVVDVYVEKHDIPAEARLETPFEPDLAIAGTEHRYEITFGNAGSSVALNVQVSDLLDYKQAGILGETFVRCEAIDPDDQVTCSFAGGNVVNVTQYKHNNQVILPGSLMPGEQFRFWLVTKVDSGYVLDATDFLAEDCARITTTSSDAVTTNNTDCEDTLIIAEADLELEKTDQTGGFLECDPVVRGGTITYDLVVTNAGPSDAAEVYVVDQLPALGVVLDPSQVDITTDSVLQVVEVRDDGRITLRIGHDPNNLGVAQWGRLNAGSTAAIRIQVTVALTAACGAELENDAWVETRENDAMWPVAPQPFPGVDGGARTPTLDPDLGNNQAMETTTVACPEVTVKKTVSFNGQCPGQDLPSVWNKTAQPVTFCFEVTNAGTTYLDEIYLEDTVKSRTRPTGTVVYTDTITSGADPLLPVAPGETVKRQVTIPQLLVDTLWDCGKVTDTVTVVANPVNSGRTDLTCVPDVTAKDTRLIEVPCAGVDWRLQLPVIGDTDCTGWIQVQNVGDMDTKAMIVYWGEAGFCPPQAAGPLKVECTGLLAPGSAWSFRAGQLPPGARSAVVYSLSAEEVLNDRGNLQPFADYVCANAFNGIVGDYDDWQQFDIAYTSQRVYNGGGNISFDFGKYEGEPLAATVNRSCPDPTDPNVVVNAAYSGISSDMEGARDPRFSGYTYYAPVLFADQGGLKSLLEIQNSGDECTSLEIWFKDQTNCMRSILGDVLTVAPGETVEFDPNTVVGPNWVGSAWIRGSQPLGIVVDTFGANHFTSYTAVAGDVWDLEWSYGNQVSYLPLTYSEYQGWDTAIEVQNLSATYAAKVKVYFLDKSGDVLTTLVDWICPRGSQTFFLPLIDSLPGNWVGSARVESQEWVTPGGPLVDPPRIHAVALMEKWADPQRTARREAVAYNGQSESLLYDWELGAGRGGTASGSAVMAVPLIAKDYNNVTTELAITNLVPKPGFTDFAIFLYDQNGLIDYYCEKLNEKQVEYIDLSTWGAINPHFIGSAVISALFWEHDVWDSAGQMQRNVVGLGGVAVERVGGTLGGPDVPGDESKAFEMFPVYDHFGTSESPNCPGVPPGFTGR